LTRQLPHEPKLPFDRLNTELTTRRHNVPRPARLPALITAIDARIAAINEEQANSSYPAQRQLANRHSDRRQRRGALHRLQVILLDVRPWRDLSRVCGSRPVDARFQPNLLALMANQAARHIPIQDAHDRLTVRTIAHECRCRCSVLRGKPSTLRVLAPSTDVPRASSRRQAHCFLFSGGPRAAPFNRRVETLYALASSRRCVSACRARVERCRGCGGELEKLRHVLALLQPDAVCRLSAISCAITRLIWSRLHARAFERYIREERIRVGLPYSFALTRLRR